MLLHHEEKGKFGALTVLHHSYKRSEKWLTRHGMLGGETGRASSKRWRASSERCPTEVVGLIGLSLLDRPAPVQSLWGSKCHKMVNGCNLGCL